MNKKTIIFGTTVLLVTALIGAGVWAVCGDSRIVGNSTAGYQSNVNGALDTSILTKFWQVGNAAANNSGTLVTSNMVLPYATGYYAWSDWGNTGVVGCAPTSSRTAFVYSIENGGSGQYVLMSVADPGTNTYDFGTVTNGPGNVIDPVAIPSFSSVALSSQDASYYYYDLTWGAIANRRGYYDSDPGSDLISNIVIRYSTTPANHATGSWTVAELTAGTPAVVASSATTTQIRIPRPIASATYLAITLLFDGASTGDAIRETLFVGTPSLAFGPTAAPLFNDVAASDSSVTFTSGSEVRVASYQVYWAPSLTNTFQPVGLSTAALGDNSSYTLSYRVLTRATTYYVRVKASKTDGSFEWSDPVLVSKSAKTNPLSTKPITRR